MEASPTLEATMATKSVSVSLSDSELNTIYSAMDAYLDSFALTGEDTPEGSEELKQKISKARRRIRVHQQFKQEER